MRYAHVVQYVASSLWAIDPSKLSEIISILAFRASGGRFTAEEIEARIGARAPVARQQGGNVAVVPIRGVIAHRMGSMDDSSGGTSCERISAMLRQAMADGSVGTVVLDVDSPGGTVTGVSELAHEIADLRGKGTKQIVAQVNGTAASAAYWLASQADEIVAMPSAVTGSIGVFTAHKDLSKALAQDGIDVTLISAGKYKVEGNPFEPLSDEAKAVLQDRVDTAYTQFVQDVARGRNVTQAAVRDGYGQGRALGAPEALKAGLIDRIGTMDETIGGLVGRSASSMRAELSADESLRRAILL